MHVISRFTRSSISPELRELISTLPKEEPVRPLNLYQYQGFWYPAVLLPGLISCQKHFHAQHSDILHVTNPKSGTTWLKAITFALLNRKRHAPSCCRKPPSSHTQSPRSRAHLGDQPNPRHPILSFSTHLPYASLPESAKAACKLVYLWRDPKDMISLRPQEMEAFSIEDIFETFCKGLIWYGPFWDQVLEYWKLSKESPKRVLFLKYEDMKEQGAAEFLGCLSLQMKRISSLEVNKNGRVQASGVENNDFFRRGEVGDWKNHLSAEMAQKLNGILGDKFGGSGLVVYKELCFFSYMNYEALYNCICFVVAS